MGLDRNCINYHYRLGRLVAVVEAVTKIDITFSSKVFDNPAQKLPPQLNFAMEKKNHVLSKELFELAPVGLDERKLTFQSLGDTGHGMSYWLGYEHEKKYIADNFGGCLGIVKTTVETYTPDVVEFKPEEVKAIEDLRR